MKILEKQEKDIIPKIKQALIRGGVLVLPTDTVYGLVCNAENKEAVEGIFKIKNRDESKPIGVFVKDIGMAKRIADIDEGRHGILEKYWPGRITFILSKYGKGSNSYSRFALVGADNTIGIRIPDYALITDLFEEINFPLAQTSANISGRQASADINEVLKQFIGRLDKPDLIIDAGVLERHQASTVVDLTSDKPEILRQGGARF